MATDHPQQPLEPRVHQMLELMLQQAQHHSLLLLDPEGIILAWLAGAEAMFGYTAAEIVGQPVTRLFTSIDLKLGLAEHELRAARESGKAEDDRWQVRKDGTQIWVAGLVYRLSNAQGELVGFGKVMRDMTHLRTQMNTLENRVEALLHTDQRKNLMMSTLAHELGNTFVALRMTLELTRESMNALDERVLQRMEAMEAELELSKRLLSDLKGVAKTGTQDLTLQRRDMLLNDALAQAVETCKPLTDSKDQELTLILPNAGIMLSADPTRIHEIFVNLLNNASKYTPPGGHIWLSMTAEEDEVVVRINDTGVGVAPEMLPRLFELFSREDESGQNLQQGMGIGLWLVRNLVSLHGGTIGVRSEGKGKGTEFNVRLPFRAAFPLRKT